MNKDFRIANTLPNHWKIKRLMRLLGDRAFFSLISLWAYVTEYKPKGSLSGMDIEDIEIASDWQGEHGIFVKTLIDLALLDTDTDGTVFVHDWKEHNSYAFYGPERSLKASRAACARHRKQKASAKKRIKQENILLPARNNPAPSPSPSPSPSPNPKEEEKREEGKSLPPPPPSSSDSDKKQIDVLKDPASFVELWNEGAVVSGVPKIQSMGKERIAKFKSRIKDSWWMDNWHLAIDKIEDSDFLQGKNDRGWKANADWFLANNTNAVGIMEGKYDDGNGRE